MAQQEIPSNELFGIAKRINSELEALPLHTHAAIVQMVTVGKDHRNLALQRAHQQEQQDQQERIIRIKEAEMQHAQAEQTRRDAAALNLPDTPN